MQIRSNSELFSNAWKELDGQWGISIGFFLVAAILSAVAGQILLTFVIGGALSVGQSIFYLNVSRRNNPHGTNKGKSVSRKEVKKVVHSDAPTKEAPDPRWAGELSKLKELLANQKTAV